MKFTKLCLLGLLLVTVFLAAGYCLAEDAQEFDLADHLTLNWEAANQEYENFTDLGNYVLRIGDLSEMNLEEITSIMQSYSGAACTGIAKVADNGDTLVGRNMDIEARQFPTVLSTTSFGKYRTVNISYLFTGPYAYKDILAAGKIEENYLKAIPFGATDVFNEKGLYIETNMREPEDSISFEPTNPGKEKAAWTFLPALAAANCATVDEVVAFAKEAYDFQLLSTSGEMSGWNFSFLVADATGKYGILESAYGKIYFTPYQYGQSNYYVSPQLNALNTYGCGYDRLGFVNGKLFEQQTAEDMLELMSDVYYSRAVLYPEYAYRDESGELHFVDDQGEEMFDWRSEYVLALYIDDEGIAHGAPTDPDDPEKTKIESRRCTAAWLLDDDNFETMQAAIAEKNKQNIADMKEFFNGNEEPLRNNGKVWTSSLSFGVNCTQKSFILKVWEREDVQIEFHW